MNHIAVIDVDALDGAGNPQVTVHKLPRDLIGFSVYDVAYDAASQCFYGLTRPSSEGQDTLLLVVDISSGDPVFTTVPVTATRIDGTLQAGAPAMTYGAAILDAEGNLFIGGNAGDHDMNDATSRAGGIYQVHIENGFATLELISDAPKSYSNDGAADPRAQSPFDPVDLSSSVLLRNLSLVATAEGVLSYDDSLSGEAGADTLEGGIGLDTLLGGSAGDTLYGQDGDDALYGGAGPNSDSTTLSTYDENGLRYDLFGTLLAADDDHLFGGTGADTLSGSAGHDTLDGGAASDLLIGGSGLDLLIGGAGADLLQGGAQGDVLQGGNGADTLFGGSDTDLLQGGEDADSLSGGSGADTLQGDAGADNLSGGSGGDLLEGGRGDDALDGGSGDDTLQGDSGDDQLAAGSGSDQIAGGDGDDNLIGGTGDDTLQGEDGRDSLRGGSGDDLLQGGDDGDHLNGAGGDDTLLGGAGRDRLYLGAGADIATGGADADRFVFRNGALDGSENEITDFSVSEGDRLDLRGLEISNGADWLEENLSVTGDDLRLSLGNGTVLLLSDAADQAEILIDQIMF
jgi:Ca2+-binding RTX toxin-like protein